MFGINQRHYQIIALLEKRYKHAIDSEADKYLAFITGGALQMQTLINDLLDYFLVD